MDSNGYSGIFRDTKGFSWIPRDTKRCKRILMVSQGTQGY